MSDFYDFSCPVDNKWPTKEAPWVVTEEVPEEEEEVEGYLLVYSDAGVLFLATWLQFFLVACILFLGINQNCTAGKTSKVLSLDEEEIELTEIGRGSMIDLEGKDYKSVTNAVDAKLGINSMQQTGYEFNYIGAFLYVNVMLTAVGFQIVLIVLTVSYYYTDKGLVNWISPNQDQSLVLFEATWHIASFWMLWVIFPYNLRIQYMRRCALETATVVEVWSPLEEQLLQKEARKAAACMSTLEQTMDRVINGFCYCRKVRNQKGAATACPVVTKANGDRVIMYQLCPYIFCKKASAFIPVKIRMSSETKVVLDMKKGLKRSTAEQRFGLFGPNILDIPRPNILSSLIAEFSKGFYTYQLFMAWTWFNFGYWHMGIMLTCVFTLGGLSIAYINSRSAWTLYNLVSKPKTVKVLRREDEKSPTVEQEMTSDMLVPGDIVVVEAGSVECDMLLLEGKLALDESNLTGESMPVQKAAVDPSNATVNYHHSKSLIYAGTIALAGEEGDRVYALVLSTAGATSRGEQIRKILFEPPPLFKFDIQVKIVVVILMMYAACGFTLCVSLLGDAPVYAWFYGMYVVASALPPLLPTVFVVSVGIAAARLEKRGVISTNPARLLMAGKVRVACFDKTGTLTKPGMDFHGVACVTDNAIGGHMTAVHGTPIEFAMASCHSLSLSPDKKTYIGNSVDQQMFMAAGWTLHPGRKDEDDTVELQGVTLRIVRRFEFDHTRMTMSVIVCLPDGKYQIFTKGSAESIGKLVQNLPPRFGDVSNKYTSSGCYTLAIASRMCNDKEIDVIKAKEFEKLPRDVVESGLSIVGFLTFKNELRADTAEALAKLREGDVRTVMITGDHPLTAVHMARQCGMVEEKTQMLLALNLDANGAPIWTDENLDPMDITKADLTNMDLVVSGVVLAVIDKDRTVFENLLPHIRVFARVNPAQKIAVVEEWIHKDFIVAMCGDGGNDCGALRGAHVGLALSDSEASVVSPFTSVEKTVMSMVDLLLEGRAGLASAFASYKFVIMYGQIETINQLVNAFFHITFAEWCWAFLDGVWVIPLSFSMGLALPETKLSKKRPVSSVLGWQTVGSCVGQTFIHFIFLMIAIRHLYNQPWMACRYWDPTSADLASVDAIGDNYESMVIFLVTGMQLTASAVSLNFGDEHRDYWFKNKYLMMGALLFIVMHTCIIFTTSRFSCLFRVNCRPDYMQIQPDNTTYSILMPGVITPEPRAPGNAWGHTLLPDAFAVELYMIILANFAAVCLYEYAFILGPVGKQFAKMLPATKPLKL